MLYAAWLVVLKPATSTALVAAQALLAQLAGLMALFLVWADGPLAGLIFITAVICYVSARHFFDNFDEPYAKLLSFLWAYFGAALMWILGHWLLFYGLIAQPTLILSMVGYGLAALYYLDHTDRLSSGVRRQFIFIIVAVLIIILTFSDWGDKVV
jgi:phosphate/sulfate permease